MTENLSDLLDARRLDAAARIAELERQSGVALLDGKDTPAELQDDIEANRRELVAAENASAELVHRQREAAASEHAGRVKALRDRFRDLESERLEAVAAAGAAATQLAISLRDALDRAREMTITCQHLGKAPPTPLGDFDKRLSWLLSGVLAQVSGRPTKFGEIALRLPFVDDWRIAHERDWRDLEQKQMAAVLSEISPPKES